MLVQCSTEHRCTLRLHWFGWFHSQVLSLLVNNRLRVEERNALELQQGVIERVSKVITNPLGYHDRRHDWQ